MVLLYQDLHSLSRGTVGLLSTYERVFMPAYRLATREH